LFGRRPVVVKPKGGKGVFSQGRQFGGGAQGPPGGEKKKDPGGPRRKGVPRQIWAEVITQKIKLPGPKRFKKTERGETAGGGKKKKGERV